MKNKLLLLLTLFFVSYTFSQNSLETTFAHNNAGFGVMFNIVALNDVTIDSFSLNLSDEITSSTLEVYYKEGTIVGSSSDLDGWTLLTTVTNLASSGLDMPTALNLDLNQEILTGTTGAFQLFLPNGEVIIEEIKYTSSTEPVGTVFVEDSNIQFLVGAGIVSGTVFPSRVFNGIVFYTQSGLSVNENELAASFNLSPNPATDVVKISNNLEKPFENVIIYDFNGRVVKTIKSSFNNDTELLVNVSDLSSGIYLIKVFDESNSSAIKKIIIK